MFTPLLYDAWLHKSVEQVQPESLFVEVSPFEFLIFFSSHWSTLLTFQNVSYNFPNVDVSPPHPRRESPSLPSFQQNLVESHSTPLPTGAADPASISVFL